MLGGDSAVQILTFPIYKTQSEYFFKAIRGRTDVIELWMRVIKLILLDHSLPDIQPSGELSIIAEKMNRIFIAGENRLFSLNFPFKIYYEDAIYSVFTKSGIQLDSKNTSDIISLFSNPYFLNINPDSSFDTVIDVCANDSSSWNVFKDTLLSEAGYIRFDHDTTNENGTLHPLNHFDICYSTEATYKIGINSHVKLDKFADILNVNTDCHFLHSHR